MITESVPLINYLIGKPIISYFPSKPKFLQLEPIISGVILVSDSKNIGNVPLVLIFILIKYLHQFSSQPSLSTECNFITFNLNLYGTFPIPSLFLAILLCTDSIRPLFFLYYGNHNCTI